MVIYSEVTLAIQASIIMTHVVLAMNYVGVDIFGDVVSIYDVEAKRLELKITGERARLIIM